MNNEKENSKNIRFTVTDPMGMKIVMKDQTWKEHILPKHNETDEVIIMKNIASPDYIINNIKPNPENKGEYIVDETRQDYIGLFKYVASTGEESLKAIRTIVQKEDDDTGFVVTNFIMRKPGEIKLEGGVIYDRRDSIDL